MDYGSLEAVNIDTYILPATKNTRISLLNAWDIKQKNTQKKKTKNTH